MAIAKQQLRQEQIDTILDEPGHGPCPGVELFLDQGIGAATGGEPLRVSIFRPVERSATPAPAVLAFHGGGWQNGNPNGCGTLAKYLALRLNITTVSASYRLATRERKTFPCLLDDGMYAWNWVQSQAETLCIDPRRVAVSGESAGVLLAAHLAVGSPFVTFAANQLRPAALLANWGPVDFVARWFDKGEAAGPEEVLLGKHYMSDPSLYHRASPITYATGNLPPALFSYGRLDRLVHPRQGRLGLAAWQAAGADSELHVIHNIGHGCEGDTRTAMFEWLQAVADFVARKL